MKCSVIIYFSPAPLLPTPQRGQRSPPGGPPGVGRHGPSRGMGPPGTSDPDIDSPSRQDDDQGKYTNSLNVGPFFPFKSLIRTATEIILVQLLLDFIDKSIVT